MYRAFALSAAQTQFAYRSQVWAGLFGELVIVFARIAIWTSIYGAAGAVSAASLPEMITYAVIGGTVLTAWYPSELIYPVGRALKTGDVVVFLVKPVHYPLYLLATEAGRLAYLLATIALPVVAIVALTVGMLPPASPFHAAMFLAFGVLGFLIVFSAGAICSLLAFWMMTAFSLDWFLRAVLAIFSGSFIPFWFFPAPLMGFAHVQPFAWIAYYPAAVYLGKLDAAACWLTLLGGLAWLAVLTGAIALLWRATSRRLTIQGG